MKHSDLRFWFLDDSMDGYCTDHSNKNSKKRHGSSIQTINTNLSKDTKTPEKLKDGDRSSKGINYSPQLDSVLLNKHISRRTHEETLHKAFFENDIEEFHQLQQKYLQSNEKTKRGYIGDHDGYSQRSKNCSTRKKSCSVKSSITKSKSQNSKASKYSQPKISNNNNRNCCDKGKKVSLRQPQINKISSYRDDHQ